MSEQNPRLNVTTHGEATVIQLADRKILDEVSITQIGQELNAMVANAAEPKLVLDFANVSHMSSSALGMLITLHKRIREKAGTLKLCRIQPAIYEVFVITRLSEIFDIYPSQQQALAAMS
jgi:anti-sigma B factor antagonist